MIIDFTNQKGGVAKSTTSINVAAGLAARGYKTLLIDIDPQENSSSIFYRQELAQEMLDRIGEGAEDEDLGFTRQALADLGLPEQSFEFFKGLQEDRNLKASLYGVLVEEVPLQEVIIPTEINNLDLVPSHIYLADVDLQLAAVHDNRSARLKRAIDKIKDHYDYIIIDTPPSLGLLTINAFVASDVVIIPISTAWWALTGLRKLVATAIMVREKELNPDLQVRGILCTMLDKKTNVSGDVEKLLRNYFGEKVFATTIPKNVTLEEAHSRKLSVFDYQPNSPGAIAYNKLVDEILAI